MARMEGKTHMESRADIVNPLMQAVTDAPRPKTPGRKPAEVVDTQLTERHFVGHIQPQRGAKTLKQMRLHNLQCAKK